MLSDIQQVLDVKEHSDIKRVSIKKLPDRQQLSEDLPKHYNGSDIISARGKENSKDTDQTSVNDLEICRNKHPFVISF